MAHKHAKLMALYAQDAAETETPWELWESRKCGATEWNFLHVSPVWYDDFEYRRKPQMVPRTITYPEDTSGKPPGKFMAWGSTG